MTSFRPAPLLFVSFVALGSLIAADRPAAAPPAAKTATHEGPQKEVLAGEADEVASETIGTLSVAYLNQAFLSIGILSDAVAAETYELNEAVELLEVHLGTAVMVEEQLRKLAKSPAAAPEDAAELQNLAKIAGLIKAQGEALLGVWGGNEAKVAAWEKLREQTAAEIEKYLGDDEPATTPTK